MSEHSKELEPKIREIQEQLRKMSSEDLAEQLFHIIHGPSWTTLREVKLVRAALEMHKRHLDEMDRTMRALVKAAE